MLSLSLLEGTFAEGKVLSGIVGHSICLDYFGSSSAKEVKHLSLSYIDQIARIAGHKE